MSKKRTKPVVVRRIRRRIHNEITERQTEKIREIYSHIGRAFYMNTFEEFERRFLFFRDINLHIRWWMAMSSVLQQCRRRYPNVDCDTLAIATVCISLCGDGDASRIPARALRYLKANVPCCSSFVQPKH